MGKKGMMSPSGLAVPDLEARRTLWSRATFRWMAPVGPYLCLLPTFAFILLFTYFWPPGCSPRVREPKGSRVNLVSGNRKNRM